MKSLLVLPLILSLSLLGSGCARLNTYVDEQIEETGVRLTEELVDVEKVKIRIGGVSGEVTGLTIPNPEGFTTVNAFEIDLLRLNIGLFGTLFSSSVVLDELVVDSPVLILEQNQSGVSNLEELMDRVKKNLEQAQQANEAEKETISKEIEDPDKKPVHIIVHRLLIEGASYQFLPQDGNAQSGTLPTIELTDLGGDKGLTPAALGAVVITSMAGEMLKQVVAQKLMQGFRFEADKLLSFLDQKLALSAQQHSKLVPATRLIADGLNDALATWAENGAVDFDQYSEALAPLINEARAEFEKVLSSEQVQKFDEILSNLNQETIAEIRNALLERLADRFTLSETQMQQLRPVFQQHLAQLGDLLKRFANKPDKRIEDFKADILSVLSDFEQSLAEVLDDRQMQILVDYENEIKQRIEGLLF